MTQTFNALAESTLDSLWEFHRMGELDEAITVLRSFGHRPEAVDYALNPGSYYFPNIRGDRLIKPARVDLDAIPVVALENGVTYHSERPSLHYLQRAALQAAGFPPRTITEISQGFSRYPDMIASSGGPQGTASVYNRLWQTSNPARLIDSKPTMVFNVEPTVQGREDPLVSPALHELVHIVQSLSSPIRKPGGALRVELEAYGVQATLLHFVRVPYCLSTAMACEVDKFRRDRLGKHGFEPTPEFVSDFNRDSKFAKIVVSINK